MIMQTVNNVDDIIPAIEKVIRIREDL